MENGLRAGPIPSGVPVAYLAWMSMLLRYRGRFPWWGNFVFLGTMVPWGVSSEEGGAAHGPLHPAMHKSLETFMALLAGFFVLVLVLFFACLFWVIRLSGWFLFGHSALQDSTRVGILFGSLSLSFCLVCLPATFFSLFFFLSLSLRRWGNPNPFGFGFPLVTLLRAHGLRPRPVLPLPLIHQGPAPAPVFFFFCLAVARVGCGRFFVLGGGVSVRSVFWLVLVACLLSSCTLASCLVFRETATPGFRPQWRLAPFPLQIGSSQVTRLLLGVDPGTSRSAAGRGRGRHCDPTNS